MSGLTQVRFLPFVLYPAVVEGCFLPLFTFTIISAFLAFHLDISYGLWFVQGSGNKGNKEGGTVVIRYNYFRSVKTFMM